jgi:hypothetical protein
MRVPDLFRKLEGAQTIKSVMALLGVDRKKAIYFIHRLRVNGYVRSNRGSDQARVYYISFTNRLEGVSYYDVINENSPVKIAPIDVQNVYGKRPSFEEVLVFAIKTRSLRIILASLGLFRKIEDWQALYRLSKKNGVERQVGALYDLSRRVLRKVRRMPDRFRRFALPKKDYPFAYAVEGLRSSDFKDIEKAWRVFLPFNKADLEAYHDFR